MRSSILMGESAVALEVSDGRRPRAIDIRERSSSMTGTVYTVGIPDKETPSRS